MATRTRTKPSGQLERRGLGTLLSHLSSVLFEHASLLVATESVLVQSGNCSTIDERGDQYYAAWWKMRIHCLSNRVESDTKSKIDRRILSLTMDDLT